MTKSRPDTPEEKRLRVRARALGYTFKRRGTEYRLVDEDGLGPGGSLENILRIVGALEGTAPPVKFETQCGTGFTIGKWQ
jgi:hypothetical protein